MEWQLRILMKLQLWVQVLEMIIQEYYIFMKLATLQNDVRADHKGILDPSIIKCLLFLKGFFCRCSENLGA